MTFEPAVLVLEDGTRYLGHAYGARGQKLGEVVFATGMTGYQETLTDPSYAGQIVLMTAPHIGNTGVNDEDPESAASGCRATSCATPAVSSPTSAPNESLDDQLAEQGIVGISGIDTRAVTRRLRDAGSMRGGIFSGDGCEPQHRGAARILHAAAEMAGQNLSAEVSTSEAYVVAGARREHRQPRRARPRCEDIDDQLPRGARLRGARAAAERHASTRCSRSNRSPSSTRTAPATPRHPTITSRCCTEVLEKGLPFFGICFGNQLLGRALGFGTYKLPFGHRGINQPVLDSADRSHRDHRAQPRLRGRRAGRRDRQSPAGFGRVEVSHVGLNDNVVEGLRALDIPAFSVQYHPEAAAGPHDANYLFDRFRDLCVIDDRKKDAK